jgi:hypothetical protein
MNPSSSRVFEAIEVSSDPVERLRLAMRVHLRTRYDSIWDGLIYAAAASGQLVDGLDLSLVRKFAFGGRELGRLLVSGRRLTQSRGDRGRFLGVDRPRDAVRALAAPSNH